MADIFLSYDDVDRDRIRPLVQALEARGWRIWWDRDIPIGRSFDDVIEEELGKAKCVLVAWSRTSTESRWVRTEAGEAANRGVLVPFQLEDCKIPLAFRRIQTAQLVDWDGSADHPGLEQLTEAISRLCGPPAGDRVRGVPTPTPSREEQERKPATNWWKRAAIGAGVLAAVLLVVWFNRGRDRPPRSGPGKEPTAESTRAATEPETPREQPSDTAASGQSATPPSRGPQVQPREPVQVVRIHMSAGGSLSSHGFVTPRGKILAFAPTPNATSYFVSWEENGRRREGRARVVAKRRDRGLAPYLALLERPKGLRLRTRPSMRSAGSLAPGERIERYLSPSDRTPGKVLEISAKRSLGGSLGVTLSEALITTNISGPGDAGAPVLDSDGKVVAILVGGGGNETISIPIESVKIAFQAGF